MPVREQVRTSSVLLRRIMTLTREVERRLGRELGLNPTDFEAMQQLIESGPLSPSTLAERLGISTAAVTIAIDRLVAAGQVTRTPHPSDRRRLLIVPDPGSVQQTMDRLLPLVLETDAVLESYTPDEQEAIFGYLTGVVGVLADRVGAFETPGGAAPV